MQHRLEMAGQGWAPGSPLWDFVTVLVIAFSLATIVGLLRKKQ
ncbi:hypothetical protein [Streptomyces sp. NRRL F-5123]|nr:hypothetical protein [Streptomyces sp. NRRL F-5123]